MAKLKDFGHIYAAVCCNYDEIGWKGAEKLGEETVPSWLLERYTRMDSLADNLPEDWQKALVTGWTEDKQRVTELSWYTAQECDGFTDTVMEIMGI